MKVLVVSILIVSSHDARQSFDNYEVHIVARVGVHLFRQIVRVEDEEGANY